MTPGGRPHRTQGGVRPKQSPHAQGESTHVEENDNDHSILGHAGPGLCRRRPVVDFSAVGTSQQHSWGPRLLS